MNLTTPLMDARKIMSTTYVDALYLMFKDMAGSATTLQDDVAGVLYTPNSTFEINPNKSFDCNDSASIALTLPAAYQAFAADDDIISMTVCKIPTPTSLSNFAVGAGTQGIANRFWDSSGNSGPLLDDNVNTQIVLTEAITTPVVTSDQYILSAVAWDRSVGGEHYMYNLATDTVLRDFAVAEVADAIFTPTATMRFTNMSNVLIAAVFRFSGASLPAAATWKADMVNIAKTVIAEKD